MLFQIPAHLNRFSAQGLEELRAEAATEYASLMGSVNSDAITDEQLERLEALRAFDVAAATELDGRPEMVQARTDRASRLAALNAQPEVVEEVVTEMTPEPEAVVAAATTPPAVRVADVAAQSTATTEVDAVEDETPAVYATITAAADVPGYSSGQEMNLLDVARAFLARTSGFAGRGQSGYGQYGVAAIRRDYPAEFQVNGNDDDLAVLARVADERRLPGGSLLQSTELRRQELAGTGRDALVAAAGWCAPSETVYDVCFQGTTDGLADFPEVQARRGGIRSNTGIEWTSIYGDGTGFFNLSEAEVAAATAKTCLEINCPTFTDTRLGVTGLCLTGNILTNRGYPEYVAEFVRGALVALAHRVNQLQIAAVVTGSTAVDLTGTDPWDSDGSVISQVLSAIEVAVVDMKYRLRLNRTATLEAVFPFWLLAQMRADWVRRNGVTDLTLADAAIVGAMAARGIRPQFVYDWQDAFAGLSGGPGPATPLKVLPASVKFLLYPAGTWVRAVQDVITLNAIYDSTKLATNQVTQLFTEDGWAMIKQCPISRVYTVPICPTGATGAQRAVDCITA